MILILSFFCGFLYSCTLFSRLLVISNPLLPSIYFRIVLSFLHLFIVSHVPFVDACSSQTLVINLSRVAGMSHNILLQSLLLI